MRRLISLVTEKDEPESPHANKGRHRRTRIDVEEISYSASHCSDACGADLVRMSFDNSTRISVGNCADPLALNFVPTAVLPAPRARMTARRGKRLGTSPPMGR